MKQEIYYKKIISIDNFYKTIYKKNINRMTTLAIANKLSEKSEVNNPITFFGDGSRFTIKMNVFDSKPEFIFDIEKKDFGFNLGTIDYNFIIYSIDIFKKYLKVNENEIKEVGKKYFNNVSPILKYQFILKYIDKLYEYEINNEVIKNDKSNNCQTIN